MRRDADLAAKRLFNDFDLSLGIVLRRACGACSQCPSNGKTFPFDPLGDLLADAPEKMVGPGRPDPAEGFGEDSAALGVREFADRLNEFFERTVFSLDAFDDPRILNHCRYLCAVPDDAS